MVPRLVTKRKNPWKLKKEKSLKTRGSRCMPPPPPPRFFSKPMIKMVQSGTYLDLFWSISACTPPTVVSDISTLQSEQYVSNLWHQPAKATSSCFLSGHDHDHLFAHVLSMSLACAAPCVTISTWDISFGQTRISRKTFKGSPHGRNSQKWRRSSLAYADISHDLR